jgi:hypothetical protein
MTSLCLVLQTTAVCFDAIVSHDQSRYSCTKACPKGQACAIVQDEAQGWKGLLFHSS